MKFKKIIEILLNSAEKLSTSPVYSVDPLTFSALITSVIVYKTDKITLRSTESANETATFLIATVAVEEFLNLMKLN